MIPGIEGDLGHDGIDVAASGVSLDARLKNLPRAELLAIVERQANAIRVLQAKAAQRAALLDSLDKQLPPK